MQISSDTTYLFRIYIFLGTSQRSKGCSKINWQSKASTKTKIWSKYARKDATFIIKNAKINQKVTYWGKIFLTDSLLCPKKDAVNKDEENFFFVCFKRTVYSIANKTCFSKLKLWPQGGCKIFLNGRNPFFEKLALQKLKL